MKNWHLHPEEEIVNGQIYLRVMEGNWDVALVPISDLEVPDRVDDLANAKLIAHAPEMARLLSFILHDASGWSTAKAEQVQVVLRMAGVIP